MAKLATQYVMDGGMPKLLSMKSQQSRRTYMGGLIETIITKDIAKRFNISDVEIKGHTIHIKSAIDWLLGR